MGTKATLHIKRCISFEHDVELVVVVMMLGFRFWNLGQEFGVTPISTGEPFQ